MHDGRHFTNATVFSKDPVTDEPLFHKSPRITGAYIRDDQGMELYTWDHPQLPHPPPGGVMSVRKWLLNVTLSEAAARDLVRRGFFQVGVYSLQFCVPGNFRAVLDFAARQLPTLN